MDHKDTLFSKHKVKDLARDLPTQLKEVEESFNKMKQDFNNVPEYMDYLSMVVDAKSKGETVKSIDFANLHTQLENNLTLLLKLASEKYNLKESARTRKALIKTGGVKDEIEKQLPQATLERMVDDLAKAYSKFNDYSIPSFSHSIIDLVLPEGDKIIPDGLLISYKYNKNFIESKPDIKGKELRDLFINVLSERDKLVKVVALQVKLVSNAYSVDKKLNEKSIEKIESKRSI